MYSMSYRGLTGADVEKVINELVEDSKITTAIEKIVQRRLRKNPRASKEWKQSVVDSTVKEILHKLRIVDMILEEQENAGYTECWPSFSESEPHRSQPNHHHRRRAKQMNKATRKQDSPSREQPAQHQEEDLDKTQVLTITLPAAVKDMTHYQHEDNNSTQSESENSAYDGLGSVDKVKSDERDDSRAVVVGPECDVDLARQGADHSMQNDSVEYDRSSNQSMIESADTSASSESLSSHGDSAELLEGYEQSPRNWEFPAIKDIHNSLEIQSLEEVENAGYIHDADIGPSPSQDPVLNTSAVSDEPAYTDEGWEDPPDETDSSKRVKFVEPIVSDIYLTRYKYDREQVVEMFYTADEGNKFQMDFDRELDRSMQADMGWLEWMMERSDEEAQLHELEDENHLSYSYEIEDEGLKNDEESAEYF